MPCGLSLEKNPISPGRETADLVRPCEGSGTSLIAARRSRSPLPATIQPSVVTRKGAGFLAIRGDSMKHIYLAAAVAASLVSSHSITFAQTYNQYGNTVYGSNGSSYTRYGNTTYDNRGNSWSTYGNTTYGSDGSSYSRYGNTTYDNEGNSWSRYGNTTYGSDGRSCSQYGSSLYCD